MCRRYMQSVYEFSVAVIAAGSVRVTVTVSGTTIGIGPRVYTTVPTDCVKIPVPVYGGGAAPLH